MTENTATENASRTAEAEVEVEVELRIVSSGATVDDIAAVTAVLRLALNEHSDDRSAEVGAMLSPWWRREHSMRTTLTRGPGAWRNFSG